jgi:predicted dehydrogenase
MGTSTKKVNWGILSTANIATEAVIPAMLNCKYCNIVAIASRTEEKAKRAASKFDIPKAYGSYEQLLDDKEIEAVYIPLPNHMHVPWAIKAMEAGKHVLLEKPAALSSSEAQTLLDESKKYPRLKIMEAFMYRFHPQWVKVKKLITNGTIGNLKTIQSSFSFFEDDPNSIVNNKKMGGGSLMDIGCYPISLSRFLFGAEPKSVSANIEYDPVFKTDILASGIMEFEKGSSSFFSATQLAENQNVKIFGTKAFIEMETPFNPPTNTKTRIIINRDGKKEIIEFDICNQYTIQADLFSLAIIENKQVPTPLQDAINNMKVIERLIQ